jgi:hypothetical protein
MPWPVGLVLLVVLTSGACSRVLARLTLGPADVVSYEVLGPAPEGRLTYATPAAVAQATVPLPWRSPPLSGFRARRPSLTVTATGCVTVLVLVNARVIHTASGCGQPVTVSAPRWP